MKSQGSETEASYDSIARRYAEEYFHELERKPFDRRLLDEFSRLVRPGGSVCDLGCGPGQVARYLRGRGLSVRGLDLSGTMVECARSLSPDIPFEQGDMTALGLPDDSQAGLVSFYAAIHLGRDGVARALREMRRVLEPGGVLLLAFHGGEGEIHRDEWYGERVSINVILFGRDEMASHLAAAGLEVEQMLERGPYKFEYPTRRVYALARRPEADAPTAGSQ
jgi:SAM-dependent methyltransferase